MNSFIAYIGLGGGGGNIANLASKKGYKAGAINFSQRDLDSLDNIEEGNKLRITGSEGVGHNRGLATELFSENYDTVIRFIEDRFKNSEVLIFPFATGGGSGSGISVPLIDIISNKYADKVIIAIPILPDTTEPITSQINTLNVFEELQHLNICILPLDNEKVRIQNQQLGKNKMYEFINSEAVDLINKVASYTELHSQDGTFDKKDFLSLFSTKGLSTIVEVEEAYKKLQEQDSSPSAETLLKIINHSNDCSIFPPIEYEKVVRLAVITDANNDLVKYVNIPKISKDFETNPLDVYEGIYHTKEENLLVVYTGLAICTSRLKHIEELIENQKENILRLKEETLFKSKFTDFEINQISATNKKNNAFRSPLDILNKYKR
jgi:tubulin-like protein CetZ